jgi:hypothetical protein
MTWLERVRQKNLTPHSRGTDKTAKSQDRETFVSFGTSGVNGHEVFTETREVIIVAYQRFWLDYDLADGTYTPQELKKSRLLVKPGPVLRYRLRWPGGTPQPMAHTQQKGS